MDDLGCKAMQEAHGLGNIERHANAHRPVNDVGTIVEEREEVAIRHELHHETPRVEAHAVEFDDERMIELTTQVRVRE